MEEITQNSLDEITSQLLSASEGEYADIVSGLQVAELAAICNSENRISLDKMIPFVPEESLARFFELLDFDRQKEAVEILQVKKAAYVLNELSPDDRTVFLQKISPEELTGWLKMLSPSERKVASTLLHYPEESIGRLMTTEFISVRPEWSVDRSLAHIRKHGPNSETINVVYVTDKEGFLIDDLKIREILLAPLSRKIEDIMDYHFISLNAYDDQEEAIKIFKDSDRFALPVVDFGGLLVGIVTSDDLLDVVETEDTEDIQKFGGLESLDFPYVKTSFFSLTGKRAGWLIILFLGEMLTATAMGYFEEEISQAVVLVLFIPLVISSGGNSGSQAATLIIRALALKEIRLRDWWYVMRREILSGLVLGTVLGSIGFIRIALWQLLGWHDYGQHWLLISVTIFFSLIGIIMWGTLSGSMIPLILKRLNLDPATSSAPFVATLVDVTGLIIYFSIAAIVLKGTLL